MTILTTIINRLNERDPLPPLLPQKVWDKELSKQINSLSAEDFLAEGNETPSQHAIDAACSSLLLWNDDLAASHDISQRMPDALGSYLHGAMHRREGDFSNAKYWFSKTDGHPIHGLLYDEGKKVDTDLQKRGSWQPSVMVDEVQVVHENGEEDSEKGIALRKLQVLELQMLLRYSLESN